MLAVCMHKGLGFPHELKQNHSNTLHTYTQTKLPMNIQIDNIKADNIPTIETTREADHGMRRTAYHDHKQRYWATKS